jgi:hypothetical protein
MGDPAGISPELTAKVLALKEVREAVRIVLVGDQRILDEGKRIAGVAAAPDDFVDVRHSDPAGIRRGVAAKAGGESALANYRHALRMVADGKADAVCFTPFNKQAMRMAEPTYDDEILFTANVLGFKGMATEFNVLEGLYQHEQTSGGSEAVLEARRRAEEFLLERRLMYRLSTGELADPAFTQLAYPYTWHYSILRALDYLRHAGVVDERAAEATGLLGHKQGDDGRWTLEARHDDVLDFDMGERVGQPSRWLTLLAMRLLRAQRQPRSGAT